MAEQTTRLQGKIRVRKVPPPEYANRTLRLLSDKVVELKIVNRSYETIWRSPNRG